MKWCDLRDILIFLLFLLIPLALLIYTQSIGWGCGVC